MCLTGDVCVLEGTGDNTVAMGEAYNNNYYYYMPLTIMMIIYMPVVLEGPIKIGTQHTVETQ